MTQLSHAGGVFLLVLTVAFFGWLFFAGDWTREERKRLYVIGVLFLAAALFWSVFEQAGSTLNLFADRDTHNVVFGYEFPSSWYQSLNSLFIFALAPVFAWVWMRLGPREPSVPAKFAFGLLFMGLSFLVLMPAGAMAQAGSGVRVSPWWLIASYGISELGELCLSPVGLSAVTRLSPARIVGLMMGVWFLSNAFGNKLAGWAAGFFSTMPLQSLFGVVTAILLVSAVIMFALCRSGR